MLNPMDAVRRVMQCRSTMVLTGIGFDMFEISPCFAMKEQDGKVR